MIDRFFNRNQKVSIPPLVSRELTKNDKREHIDIVKELQEKPDNTYLKYGLKKQADLFKKRVVFNTKQSKNIKTKNIL